MNPATIGALAVAAVFGLGDWISRARDAESGPWKRLEYVCKPATLLSLVVAAACLDPGNGAGAQRTWFVAALVFSLAGDVLLMVPGDRFMAGLSAFLVAHLCFLAGFWTLGPSMVALAVSALCVAVVIGGLGARILPAARRRDPALAAPVTAYMVVIAAMLATALAVGNPVAGLGAALFATSDSMIAWDRFVSEFAAAPVLIMVTYHLGQAGLVLSLLR